MAVFNNSKIFIFLHQIQSVMTEQQQRQAAKQFAEYWNGRGYERGESQPFWLSLLRDVLGIEHPEQYISFEDQVHLDHTSFIDGYIDATKVMIEQKSRGKNLNAPIKQSDGTFLTPFQQVQRYIVKLPVSKHPRWVITSNFEEIWVYDMERPDGEPEKIFVKDLAKEFYRLSFLIHQKPSTFSVKWRCLLKPENWSVSFTMLCCLNIVTQTIHKRCTTLMCFVSGLCSAFIVKMLASSANMMLSMTT